MFDALAKECHLEMSLAEGFEVVREFVRTLRCKGILCNDLILLSQVFQRAALRLPTSNVRDRI